MKSEQGFTLMELLAVIVIVGLLASMSLGSFTAYMASAGYAVAESTLSSARRVIEATFNNPNFIAAAVPLTAQNSAGPLTDPLAKSLLPELQLPGSIKFEVAYDPACTTAACEAEVMQARHCKGKEYVRWVRYGDGVGVYLEHIAGAGCA